MVQARAEVKALIGMRSPVQTQRASDHLQDGAWQQRGKAQLSTNVYDTTRLQDDEDLPQHSVIWAVASICLSINLRRLQDQWIATRLCSKAPGNLGCGTGALTAKTVLTRVQGFLSATSICPRPGGARCFRPWRSTSVHAAGMASPSAWPPPWACQGVRQPPDTLRGVHADHHPQLPTGWTTPVRSVVNVCGPKADDLLGTCDIRWVYMLAVVGCADYHCWANGPDPGLAADYYMDTKEEEEAPDTS